MLVRTLVLVFIAYFTIIIADSERPEMNELSAKCSEENGLKMEDVANLNKTRHLETDDKRLKCYIRCVLHKLNLMNEEGDLTLEGHSDKKMKYKEYFPACKDVSDTDPCDKAVSFQNCIWKQINMKEKTPE